MPYNPYTQDVNGIVATRRRALGEGASPAAPPGVPPPPVPSPGETPKAPPPTPPNAGGGSASSPGGVSAPQPKYPVPPTPPVGGPVATPHVPPTTPPGTGGPNPYLPPPGPAQPAPGDTWWGQPKQPGPTPSAPSSNGPVGTPPAPGSGDGSWGPDNWYGGGSAGGGISWPIAGGGTDTGRRPVGPSGGGPVATPSGPTPNPYYPPVGPAPGTNLPISAGGGGISFGPPGGSPGTVTPTPGVPVPPSPGGSPGAPTTPPSTGTPGPKTNAAPGDPTAKGTKATAPGEQPHTEWGPYTGKAPENPEPGDTIEFGGTKYVYQGGQWINPDHPSEVFKPPENPPKGGGGGVPTGGNTEGGGVPTGGNSGGGGGGGKTPETQDPDNGTGGKKPPTDGTSEPQYADWLPLASGAGNDYSPATGGLVSYYNQKMGSNGMDPDAFVALRNSTMTPILAQANQAKEAMIRARAATGNDAGIYAGFAQASDDASKNISAAARQDYLANDQIRRQQQQEGAAGNLNLYGQEQAQTMEYLRMLGNLLGRQQSVSSSGSSSGVDAGIAWNPGGSQM